MIAVFLPSLPFRGKDAPYLWVFYRLLTSLKEPSLYIIGKDYLKKAEEWEQLGRDEVTLAGQKHFNYELPTEETLQRNFFELIDDEPLEDVLSSKNGNLKSAFKIFLTEAIPKLQEKLHHALSRNTNIEAVLTWCNCPSLEIAAAKLGIPVIHLELGPLRAPLYRQTAYMDFTGVNGNTEASLRYHAEAEGIEFGVTLEELRKYFQLRETSQDQATVQHLMGVPLQVEDDSNLIAFSNDFDNQTLITYAQNLGKTDTTLIRPHPASMFSFKATKNLVQDESSNSQEFISKCCSIITINSSVGLEAILMNKSVTILGDCSFAFINDAADEQERVRRTAFYLFVYLVPYELIFDPVYLRFRLTSPSMVEIINRHLEYYAMNTTEIKPSGIGMDTLLSRAIVQDQIIKLQSSNDSLLADNEALNTKNNSLVSEKADLENRLSNNLAKQDALIKQIELELAKQRTEKDTHIQNLNTVIHSMHNSTSWKLTRPLRESTFFLRRVKNAIRLIPSLIRRGGGIQGTTKKAIAIWRLQGTAGLIAKLRWINKGNNFAFVGQETREVPDRHDYARWVAYYDTIDDNVRRRISEEIKKWARKPLISIIMPVYNPPIDLLREAVDSVKAQLYPNWQLCLADDASTQLEVLEYLKSLAKDDKRIKIVFRPENGHISRASNSALEVATGQYVALMDNDDLLPEHALYWVARTIIENPDVGLVYSDEDKINADGKRSSPYFKSDWNEFLFRSQNMICHLGVYRRDLVDKVGQFRPDFDGAQDYDLALRCIEQLEREQIIHIPRVLYHWRIHAGSTAMAGDEKPYAALAGVKALDEHLQRKGNIGSTELLPMGMYRVHYQLPEQLPLVSLIIPTRNAHGLVKQCIDSIKTLTTYPSYEIILIDNGSDDPESLEYFAEIDQEDNIHVVRDDGPFNYSELNNGAVRQARGELIGLINNDIEIITPEWLDEMVSIALQPNVGAVGARLWYPDDRLQHGGVIVGVGGVAGHSHKYLPKGDYGYFCRAALIQELSAVTAACLIIKKSIFNQVHGLDEENLKIAFNDVDFCLRVQEAGYINVWTPFAEMYHHESATRGLEDTPQKKERFMKEVTYIQARWPDIQNDYAYNPNLTLDHEDFGLAWPPRVEI
jgi:glycosyltransferase involved in cell wall biosynthesis